MGDKDFKVYKAVMCHYFGIGNCQRGDRCTFAHSAAELRSYPNMRKHKLCNDFLKGKCRLSSEKCLYAHSAEEIAKAKNDALAKPALCAKFFESGYCRKGANCTFAHSVSEVDTSFHNGSPNVSDVYERLYTEKGKHLHREGKELSQPPYSVKCNSCQAGIIQRVPSSLGDIPNEADKSPPILSVPYHPRPDMRHNRKFANLQGARNGNIPPPPPFEIIPPPRLNPDFNKLHNIGYLPNSACTLNSHSGIPDIPAHTNFRHFFRHSRTGDSQSPDNLQASSEFPGNESGESVSPSQSESACAAIYRGNGFAQKGRLYDFGRENYEGKVFEKKEQWSRNMQELYCEYDRNSATMRVPDGLDENSPTTALKMPILPYVKCVYGAEKKRVFATLVSEKYEEVNVETLSRDGAQRDSNPGGIVDQYHIEDGNTYDLNRYVRDVGRLEKKLSRVVSFEDSSVKAREGDEVVRSDSLLGANREKHYDECEIFGRQLEEVSSTASVAATHREQHQPVKISDSNLWDEALPAGDTIDLFDSNNFDNIDEYRIMGRNPRLPKRCDSNLGSFLWHGDHLEKKLSPTKKKSLMRHSATTDFTKYQQRSNISPTQFHFLTAIKTLKHTNSQKTLLSLLNNRATEAYDD